MIGQQANEIHRKKVARPKRFELLTPKFVVWGSDYPQDPFSSHQWSIPILLPVSFLFVLAISLQRAYYVLTS